MKISILCCDLSSNALGRAYMLAKILQRRYAVEIIGPVFGDGIWKPVANLGDIEYKYVKIGKLPQAYCQIVRLFKEKIDGDVLYACKPYLTSIGLGLFKKVFDKKPLVLDIDDWDRGLMVAAYKRYSRFRYFSSLALSIPRFYSTGSYINVVLSEKLIGFADKITVSNRFLANKFGGETVWQARDTDVFNPDYFDNFSIRI